jgi:thiol:disulfide interchange protein DsbC
LRLVLFAVVLVPAVAGAEEFPDLRRALSEKLPQVKIGEIRKLAHAGLYEIQANDVDVFYTDAKGEVGLFGNLVELSTNANLSEQRKQEWMTVDFAALPLAKAVVTVKGNGARRLAVFSDPDCPYCQRLERELAGVTDVTIYTFLYPIANLHPDAPRKSRLVWCAEDRARAWEELMLHGKEPGAAGPDCEAPLGAVADTARKIWINGTPGIVFESGKLVPGAIPKEQIESLLGSPGEVTRR